MIVDCPSCSSRFVVGEASLTGGPRRVKCGRCAHVWPVSLPAAGAPAVRAAPPAAAAGRVGDSLPAGGAAAAAARTAPHASGTAPRAPARERRGGGLWIGWLLLVVVVVGVAAGGYLARGWLVETWPQAERFYAWVGIPLPRIEIAERSDNVVEQGDTARLDVGGVLINHADVALPVPHLTYVLYDQRGEPMSRVPATPPPTAALGPGDSITFSLEGLAIYPADGAKPVWEVFLDRPSGDDGAALDEVDDGAQ